MQKFDPELSALKRPPIRPYAAYSAHDPDTQYFRFVAAEYRIPKGRLCREQRRRGACAHDRSYCAAHPPCRTLRTILRRSLWPCAAEPAERREFLSDRRPRNARRAFSGSCPIITEWILRDWDSTISGFRVESVDAVKRDLEFLIGENPHLRGRALGYGSEGEARLKLSNSAPSATTISPISRVCISMSRRPRRKRASRQRPSDTPQKPTKNAVTAADGHVGAKSSISASG